MKETETNRKSAYVKQNTHKKKCYDASEGVPPSISKVQKEKEDDIRIQLTNSQNSTNRFSKSDREAIGPLPYMCGGSRPCIACDVSILNRRLEAPTARDYDNVNRVFKYLGSITDHSVTYTG